MSDYFTRVEAHLLDAVERRARPSGPLHALRAGAASAGRWLRGRRPMALALAGALAVSGSAAGAMLLSGQRSQSLTGVVPPYDAHGNLSMAGSHYEISITPVLFPGSIGWCDFILYRGVPELQGHSFGSGGCGAAPPAVGSPLFAPDGSRGEGLWYVLSAPQVAAVRVAGGPTVLTRSDPRLPYGYRAAVFKLPQGAVRRGLPQLTALDRNGRPIPGGMHAQPPREPLASWSDPRRRVSAACSIDAVPGSGVALGAGSALTAIAPDPRIIGRAFLSCSAVLLRSPKPQSPSGPPPFAALVLDAKRPGSPPAPFPGMRALPSKPGLYEVSTSPPVTHRLLLARRLPGAWLVVGGYADRSQGARVLAALTAGRIDLSARPAPVRPPADAECAIEVRGLPGLRPISQRAALIHGRRAPMLPARLGRGPMPCAEADYYLREWSLSVTALWPPAGAHRPPPLPGAVALRGRPGLFTVPGEAEGRDLLVRRGGVWVEIRGGEGVGQRLQLIRHLKVRVASARPRLSRPPHPSPLYVAGLG